MTSYESNDVKIINANILDVQIPENSIDLIVTSPPYNLGINYESNDDNLSYNDYLKFSSEWLSHCLKFLKPDGRICLNIPLDCNRCGHQSMGADIITVAKQAGFQYRSTIIWNKSNISKRTSWGSWLSASSPAVIAQVELIIVFYKKVWKKTSGSKISDITKREFVDWTNGLWSFPGVSSSKSDHPAPFPVELPKRCIKLFSYVDDVVLDPFCGSSTTGVAASRLSRKYIGVDISQKYAESGWHRIVNDAPLFAHIQVEKKD